MTYVEVFNIDNYYGYREINDRSPNVLPCNIYTITGDMGGGVPLHWHDEAEIIFPKTDGYALIDGKQIEFNNNDIVICNSTQLHTTSFNKKGIVYHVVIEPKLYLIPYISKKNRENITFPNFIPNPGNKYIKLLDELVSYGRPVAKKNEYRTVSLIFSLLDMLMGDNLLSYNNAQSLPQINYVKEAMQYIEAHLADRLSVGDIASHIGLSNAYFMRLFKNVTGKTVSSYIHLEKIRASKEDIKAGAGISETAYRYGYSDAAHFCNTFKKYEGSTPKEHKL